MCTRRPWYPLTATYPKDMVIMLDKSRSMDNQFGSNSRMFYGKAAADAVIKSLNPNDNVRIQTK